MIGLPPLGARVKVWPYPGRRIQDGPRPVDAMGGGRWLPSDGLVVEWTPFTLEQYRHGDLLLHEPPKTAEPKTAAKDEVFDPIKASDDHMKAIAPEVAPKPEAKPSPLPSSFK